MCKNHAYRRLVAVPVRLLYARSCRRMNLFGDNVNLLSYRVSRVSHLLDISTEGPVSVEPRNIWGLRR